MSPDGTVACVLVAAGRGERLGETRPKAFVPLGGQPLVWHAMRAIAATRLVRGLVVVVPAGYEQQVSDLYADATGTPTGTTFRAVAGGDTRQRSAALGLSAVPSDAEVVLVHDAARCLAPPELYDAVADEVSQRHDAVVPGLPVVDTLKQVDGAGKVVATPDRAHLRAVQTPQGFRRAVLTRAHAEAGAHGVPDATDDASLVERLGLPVHVVPGRAAAFKVTGPEDLLAAETLVAAAQAQRDEASAS